MSTPTGPHISVHSIIREPCHTICDLLPTLADSDVACHDYCCRVPPPGETKKQNKAQQNTVNRNRGSSSYRFHLLFELEPCHTDSHLLDSVFNITCNAHPTIFLAATLDGLWCLCVA